jgi:hypothetical protein
MTIERLLFQHLSVLMQRFHVVGWWPFGALSLMTASFGLNVSADRSTSKYVALMQRHLFAPIAFETFAPICVEGRSVIRDIGKRNSAAKSHPRETACLFQRISTAIQRYNAICCAGTFASASDASNT